MCALMVGDLDSEPATAHLIDLIQTDHDRLIGHLTLPSSIVVD
jgi:hypothetical protein